MKNKEKMNNKGFSLVELIIVIAIMVILVGVLAPVYTRYVESTRKSSDVDALSSIANAMEIVLIDHSARGATGITITATFDAAGKVTFSDDGDGSAASEVTATIGSYTLKGAWGTKDGTLAATIATTGTNAGTVTYTPDSAKVVHLIGQYSLELGKKINVPAPAAP